MDNTSIADHQAVDLGAIQTLIQAGRVPEGLAQLEALPGTLSNDNTVLYMRGCVIGYLAITVQPSKHCSHCLTSGPLMAGHFKSLAMFTEMAIEVLKHWGHTPQRAL